MRCAECRKSLATSIVGYQVQGQTLRVRVCADCARWLAAWAEREGLTLLDVRAEGRAAG